MRVTAAGSRPPHSKTTRLDARKNAEENGIRDCAYRRARRDRMLWRQRARRRAYPRPVRMILPFGSVARRRLIRIVATLLPDALWPSGGDTHRRGRGASSAGNGRKPTRRLPAARHGVAHSIFRIVQERPYDPLNASRDHADGSQPYGLSVASIPGVKTVKELIALSKKDPRKYYYASSARGAMHCSRRCSPTCADIGLSVQRRVPGARRSDGVQVKIGASPFQILSHHRAGS